MKSRLLLFVFSGILLFPNLLFSNISLDDAPPVADYTPSGDIGLCPDNLNIQFTDHSTGDAITDWNWTFSGIGVFPTSSTARHPQVSVTEGGTLTVSLTVTNADGDNTITRDHTVTILAPDSSECSDCGDTFYDIGGVSCDYTNDLETISTFCPYNSDDKIMVEFTHVDIEVSTGSGVNNTGCEDLLQIFDGDDVSSTLVGQYCGEESGDGDTPSDASHNLPIGYTYTATNSTGCLTFKFNSDDSVVESGWIANITCVADPMPVSLSSIHAESGKDKITIKWETSSEIDNNGFYIERSIDGNRFEAIGWIEGTNSLLGDSYSFADYSVINNRLYFYRIKQIDFDGKTSISRIIEVSLAGENSVTLFPNPVTTNKKLNLLGLNSGENEIRIIDYVGKQIISSTKYIIDSETVSLDVSNLEQGIYLIEIINGNSRETTRFIVK